MRIAPVVAVALLTFSCAEEGLDLVGAGSIAALTVEVAVPENRWNQRPQYVALGSGPNARIQQLDASQTTVFDAPGQPPFVVTLATSRRQMWTKTGIRGDRVRFEDVQPELAPAPYAVAGRIVGAAPGDTLQMVLFDGSTRGATNDLTLDPSNQAFEFQTFYVLTENAKLAAVALRDGVPVAYGIASVDPTAPRQVALTLAPHPTEVFDVVIEGVESGLTSAEVRAGFGDERLVEFTAALPKPFDYRERTSLAMPVDMAVVALSTKRPLDGMPSRRRQSAQWSFRGGDERLDVLSLPVLDLEVGSLSSFVVHDTAESIGYTLPDASHGTLWIAEALHQSLTPLQACETFRWRIELDPAANAVELPRLPLGAGFARMPRGIPLSLELEAVDTTPGADRVSATSGVVVFDDPPDCGEDAPLPDWLTGSFVRNPTELCGSLAEAFTISACGDWRWTLPDTDLTRSGCGRLSERTDDDVFRFVDVGGRERDLVISERDVAMDLTVREPWLSFAKLTGVEAAEFPRALVGVWIPQQASSRVIELPDDTPVAGRAYDDGVGPSELGAVEIDHHGQLFVARGSDDDRRGTVVRWSGETGTVRFTNGPGLCSTIDRTATLTRVSDERLLLTTIERYVDIWDRDGDGDTIDLVGIERVVELARFSVDR